MAYTLEQLYNELVDYRTKGTKRTRALLEKHFAGLPEDVGQSSRTIVCGVSDS